MGVSNHIGDALYGAKAWDRQGCLHLFPCYVVMVFDNSHGGHLQHRKILSNHIQGILPLLCLPSLPEKWGEGLDDARRNCFMHYRLAFIT